MNWLADFAAHAPFLLTVTPLFGAALAWITARRGVAAARQTAITNATLTLGVALIMAWKFEHAIAQMTSVVRWWRMPLTAAAESPALQFDIVFGVDGISLAPLLVIALAGWVVIWTADRCCSAWGAMSYAGLLLGQSLAMAMFAAQDFLIFLLSSELWAWWAFFMIGRAGGTERKSAASLFLASSSLAHACWGLGAIGLATAAAWIQVELRGQPADISFRFSQIVWQLARWVKGNETALEVWMSFQPWVISIWLFGLWLRWPIFPAHRWWSGLWTESRAPMVAFCGATLILEGGYVFFRFIAPLMPAATAWGWLLTDGATLGTLYFGFLAFSQTEWRRLGCYLSLAISQAAVLCGISGIPDIALAGWQMLLMASLSVAALALLVGWQEQRMPCVEGDSGETGTARRWWGLMAVCGAVLGTAPCLAGITGMATLELWELAQRSVPNLMLLCGGLLSAWAVIRALFLSPAARVPGDLAGREVLIGLLVAAALGLGAMPAVWQTPLRPAWEQLYDPFARQTSTAEVPEQPVVTLSAHKPAVTGATGFAAEPFWMRAPLLWIMGGAVLLLIPRGWLTFRWEAAIAVLSLIGGLLIDETGESPASGPNWAQPVLWSLTLIGLVQLTVLPAGRTSTPAGAILLRLSAAGWAALSHDLLLAGLAWELAEMARWMSVSTEAQRVHRPVREHMRHLISSVCFWGGVLCCLSAWGSTNFAEWAAQIAKSMPRGGDGQIPGIPSRTGLAAGVLLISAVGVRCGLIPWSLGHRHDGLVRRCGDAALDQWLSQLLGLTLLVQIVSPMSAGYGGPLSILCAMAAAGTSLWSGLRILAAATATQLVRGLMANQFAGLVLILAAVAVQSFSNVEQTRELFDHEQLLRILAIGIFAATLAVCGVIALISRLGEPLSGELFLEHYQGIFVRRRFETILLIASLWGLVSCWPAATFWPAWLGVVGEVMTPMAADDGPFGTHPVLLAGAILVMVSGWLHLKRVIDWIRCLTLDPPVAIPEGSGRTWDAVVAIAAVVVSLTMGWFPGLMLEIWKR